MPSGSNQIERFTPAWIFEGLNFQFTLDPAAPEGWCPSKDWCSNFYSSNGLEQEWFGTVWLNPPWRRGEKKKWVRRLKEHGNGLALCRGGVDSSWLHDNEPDGLFLFPKRVGYLRSDGIDDKRKDSEVGGFEPSMLIAFGVAINILRRSKLKGMLFDRYQG